MPVLLKIGSGSIISRLLNTVAINDESPPTLIRHLHARSIWRQIKLKIGNNGLNNILRILSPNL